MKTSCHYPCGNLMFFVSRNSRGAGKHREDADDGVFSLRDTGLDKVDLNRGSSETGFNHNIQQKSAARPSRAERY
jgi:hypothetical protein